MVPDRAETAVSTLKSRLGLLENQGIDVTSGRAVLSTLRALSVTTNLAIYHLDGAEHAWVYVNRDASSVVAWWQRNRQAHFQA